MESMNEAFTNYVVVSNQPGPGFYIFIVAYTAFAFFIVSPLVKCSRGRTDDASQLIQAGNNLEGNGGPQSEKENCVGKEESSVNLSPPINRKASTSNFEQREGKSNEVSKPAKSTSSLSGAGGSILGMGRLLRELEKVASAEYPDQDPDFQSILSGPLQHQRQADHLIKSKTPTENSSGLPSAATTSRLHVAHSPKRFQALMLDVGGRRWKHRRPIGRVDFIQNAIHNESATVMFKNLASTTKRKLSKNGMSDVASSMLDEQRNETKQKIMNRSPLINRYRYQRSVASMTSGKSVMSSIVDDISPNDAADANDPGRGNIFVNPENQTLQRHRAFSELKLGCLSPFLESLLELAAPDEETVRVFTSSFLLSIGAMSEGSFRVATAVFISQYLGTESMVAYLLVGLFVRLTSEELSGAIIDALSTFVQTLLMSGNSESGYIVGQYVQLAILLQLLLGIPLLLAWALGMDAVVFWLVQETSIASTAQEYARVVVFNYLIQSVARTCTVVFHICGHEHFESVVDCSASAVQLVLVGCIVALFDGATLSTVGYIQVLIGSAASVAKVMYPVMRGWMEPFQKGLTQSFAFTQNSGAFFNLLRATAPLLVGTILEYGEWELLTLFLKHLGPAEVATWALLGSIWDILEALTEGIGEAAAVQVAFLLAAAQPERAKKLSYTAIYMAVIQAVLLSSFLLMIGKYISILFSNDPTIQHMTNNAIPLIGLANVTMSFSQICWSLIGAQGRFRLATSVVFFSRWLVTVPVALISIFVFFLGVNSVCGSLVVGYATSSCALTFLVIRSDWERLSRLMQEIDCAVEGDELEYLEDFDDDSSSSSSSFGDVDDSGDNSTDGGMGKQPSAEE